MPKPGYVYLLASKPNGTLYLGVTSDLTRRAGQHKTGETPGFASRYGANRLVWFERHEDIRDAITREKQLKKWNRAWKLRLVRERNPAWRHLFGDVASLPAAPLAMEGRRTDSYLDPTSGHSRAGGNPNGDGAGGEGDRRQRHGYVRESEEESYTGGSRHSPMDSRLRGNDSGEGRGQEGPRASAPLAPAADRAHPARGLWRLVLGAVVLALTLAGCAGGCSDPTEIQLANEGPESLAALAVEIGPRAESDTLSESRAFVQASGGGAYLYDALAHTQDDPAMGLTVGGERVLDSWSWWLDADSLVLDGDDRHRGVARPDFAVRAYLERDTTDFVGSVMNKLKGDDRARFVERVTLLDSRDSTTALLIHAVDSLGTVAFRPAIASGANADSARTVGESLVVYSGGAWTAIRASGGTPRVDDIRSAPEAGREAANVPGEVSFPTPGAVVVATGPTPQAADSLAGLALQNDDALRQRRAERLAALVEAVPLVTEDEAFDRAVRWSAVTLDMLVAEDSTRLTVATGLPGAAPQPGLSTVQATQALLDLGRWEDARKLVATFGRAQLFDRQVDLLGRAPNVVTASGDAEFGTADATPLFIAASGDYVRTTGDRGLVTGSDNFWFKTVFAMRGLYEPDARNGNALDASGFLLSRADRSAWMETDPASGGFERRGPVVEAQGALYRALKTVRSYAEVMGVAGRSNTQWYADTARVLQSDFERRFLTESAVADRLSAQGPVAEIRPAALLALDAFDLAPEAKARYARALAERLAYPYGVGSVPQTDSLFHPFLREPAFYPEGAARYGGAISTWMAGPLARLMAGTGGAEPAWELTQAQAQLVTDRGVVGAIPEFLDAHPRQAAGEVGVGGAPVQPWSVAELIRTAMEGFVGASWPDSRTLQVQPRLPDSWGETTTRLRLGDGAVALTLRASGDGVTATVAPEGRFAEGATLRLVGPGGAVRVPLATAPGDTARTAREPFEVEIDGASATVDGESVEAEAVDPTPEAWEGFAFVAPDVRDEYPVMRAVESQRDLSPGDILQANPGADVIATKPDPDGDDWGSTNTFTYPEDVPEGVLDATYLEVTEDDSTTYVRVEFATLGEGSGLPPTFVTVAFDTEEGGERRVGRNSMFDMPEDEGYEFVVYVGDGIEIENGRGQSLGSLPGGGTSGFSPEDGILEFSIPHFVMPALTRGDKIVVLVGPRASGGGIGTFRDVRRTASGDSGGGKVDDRAPNVYDFIVTRVTQ